MDCSPFRLPPGGRDNNRNLRRRSRPRGKDSRARWPDAQKRDSDCVYGWQPCPNKARQAKVTSTPPFRLTLSLRHQYHLFLTAALSPLFSHLPRPSHNKPAISLTFALNHWGGIVRCGFSTGREEGRREQGRREEGRATTSWALGDEVFAVGRLGRKQMGCWPLSRGHGGERRKRGRPTRGYCRLHCPFTALINLPPRPLPKLALPSSIMTPRAPVWLLWIPLP